MSSRRGGDPPTVVVLGDVVLDVVVAVDEPPAPDSDAGARTALSGGGAGANVAAWLARAGSPTALVGRVGDDTVGATQRDELARRGITLHLSTDPAAPTGTVVAITTPDGARTMLTDRGANLQLRPEDLPTPLGGPDDHLHVSGYALLHPGPRPAAVAALMRAREAGMTTSVDASSAAPLRRCGAEAFTDWTAHVDVLRANRAEAAVLVPGATDAAAAARALAELRPLAVVTDGAAGAWVAWEDRCAHVPAASGPVVDTVGAGDALTAGFLAAWAGGAAPQAALAAGVALAAESVARAGARPPSC